MCSCFLVEFLSNSLLQMNFGSIKVPSGFILKATAWD
jgi:hypothetical protein